ncbi:MAG TPA: hypothetical protein VGM90_03145 [Kofleriaceae bacterium]|jgi:hypothetical protein
MGPVLAVLFAASRTIYLVHGGAELRPGADNGHAGTSSLIDHPVSIPAWETTEATWQATVDCVRDMYAPFAVTVTDEDPGDAPHITAIFGGSPTLMGQPRSLAGVSPFKSDCGVIESSVVFAFTDILPADPHAVCNVIAQEIAHSYGLDHELLDSDPMTTTHTTMDRAFADEDVACGETSARPCGYAGSTCRATQNSFTLLKDRLGLAGQDETDTEEASAGGCNVNGHGDGMILLIAAFALRGLNAARTRRQR